MVHNYYSEPRKYFQGKTSLKAAGTSDDMGQVQPGRHTIRMVTGAFVIEFVYDFGSGKSYTIEPFAGMMVK